MKGSFSQWVTHYGIFSVRMTFVSLHNSHTAGLHCRQREEHGLVVPSVQQNQAFAFMRKGSCLGWAAGRVVVSRAFPHTPCSSLSIPSGRGLSSIPGAGKSAISGLLALPPCESPPLFAFGGWGEGEKRLRIHAGSVGAC